jgi:16S rRNA G966 N2-methylase RsmD
VGLEALSRGYGPVTCLESGEPGWSCLRRNAAGTELILLRQDALAPRGEAFQGQAVVFLDPPYEQAARMWAALAARLRTWLAPGGVLVFETDRKTALEFQPGWQLAETREYGAARFHFWTPA